MSYRMLFVTKAVVCGLLLTLCLGVSAATPAAEGIAPAAEADRLCRAVEGNSLTVELVAMPEKYQIEGALPLELFEASSDSNFWWGPTGPNPYSWLTTSVVFLERAEFQIVFCTAEGDSIESLDFGSVEPAVYRVDLDEDNRLDAGRYMLRYRYNGAVVREFRIEVVD